jgi:HTH-type transcriptional regulator / antitoxin HigA
MTEIHDFQPTWMSPPGETIRDVLRERGLSAAWLAEKTSYPVLTINNLIEGNLSINETLAASLSSIIGASIEFWLERDAVYQKALKNTKERETQWLSQVPVSEMIKKGWMAAAKTQAEQTELILKFFGIVEKADWSIVYEGIRRDYAFRTSLSYDSNPVGVSVWLRQAEILSKDIACDSWNKKKFSNSLEGMKALIREKDPTIFLPKLKGLCASCGVALVVLPVVSGCRASGATKFLTPEKAIIVMSARYLSDDHFWFTFFHECAHLVLHESRRFTLDFNNSPLDASEPADEVEANEFSENILIPKNKRYLLHEVRHTALDVIRLAGRLGTSPGILVGQMQNGSIIPRNWLNSLKRRYKWQTNDLVLISKRPKA